jgi:hypothetical protein
MALVYKKAVSTGLNWRRSDCRNLAFKDQYDGYSPYAGTKPIAGHDLHFLQDHYRIDRFRNIDVDSFLTIKLQC